MNLISVLIGIGALLLALVGFIPFLGLLNWLVIPLALVGLVIGLLSRANNGRNINLAVLAIAIFRLTVGGGLL